MKHTPLLALMLLLPLAVGAQKIHKNDNRFVYEQYRYGEVNDTSRMEVWLNDSTASIETPPIEGTPVQGYAETHTYIDYPDDSITVVAHYPDSSYYYRTGLSRKDIEWTVEGPAKARKYTCFINSNRLVFVMDETTQQSATPLPHYGLRRGVMKSFTRNGQLLVKLVESNRINNAPMPGLGSMGRRVTPRELDRIMKERLVITTRIFDHEQIHWGAKNDHVEGGIQAFPSDTTLHFAGGTLILKRVKLPWLSKHYQHFIEIHQQSNGDAYDRTGSIFVIPFPYIPVEDYPSFFDGINNHPDSLPIFTGRDGQRYQGMMSTGKYNPAIELVRFFTPFGVGHFNNRFKLDGVEWRPEAYYKQEITDLYQHIMAADVLIGAWIGNYDGGGHLLTVDIKSYPNNYTTEGYDSDGKAQSLFNTCNVLEMAGQNYGKLFATDSLTVSFRIDTAANGARLRYISTGHGGWGEGDEFVPKTNTILIDGHPAFTHTPWRQDCGTYRDLNPVSGNFWNGTTSSDYSRSGWCPGTATQPVYFDLMPWADGKEHTLTVAIPQGKPVEGMFSHWAVSGTLIIEY